MALQTYTIAVDGMTCNGCARSLENALKRDARIESASVDFGERKAHVKGEVELDALKRLIEDAGFEARV